MIGRDGGTTEYEDAREDAKTLLAVASEPGYDQTAPGKGTKETGEYQKHGDIRHQTSDIRHQTE